MAEIRRCADRDVPALMGFIDRHWAKDHVLAIHRPLMDWQHADNDSPGLYNWLLAEDEEGIQGVLGFIPTSKYDRSLSDQPFVWLALWKIRPEPRYRTLGLQLLGTLVQSESSAVIGVLGINPKHPPMYRAMGYQTGELGHYFLCNPGLPQSLITTPAVPGDAVLPHPRAGRALLRQIGAGELDAVVLEAAPAVIPRKTPVFFRNRYLDHPIYAYRVYLIQVDGRAMGLMAARIAENGSAKVLRIVDCLGDEAAFAECGSAIGNLLRETGCEYADFWQYGFSEETTAACGFMKVRPDGDLIVPNYFEPFLRKNARIEFAVRGAGERKLALFRADGDQDRPNKP